VVFVNVELTVIAGFVDVKYIFLFVESICITVNEPPSFDVIISSIA